MAYEEEATVIEVGVKAIYAFQAHPNRRPWDGAAHELQAANRARMQGLMNALAVAGYEIEARAEPR